MTRASDRVMVVTAHPDDPEFGAGGTVAKLVKEGREVTYVIVTNGNKGSSDRAIAPARLALIRDAEQRNAARALGVGHVEFLGCDSASQPSGRGRAMPTPRGSTMSCCRAEDAHGRCTTGYRRMSDAWSRTRLKRSVNPCFRSSSVTSVSRACRCSAVRAV
jgi:LmbE family N-acetylglucosaminyl deacetylase